MIKEMAKKLKIINANEKIDPYRAVRGNMFSNLPTYDNNRWNKDLKVYSQEGYEVNSIVYRCIYELQTAVTQAKFLVKKKNKDGLAEPIFDNDLMKLLKKPNQAQTWRDFIECFVGDYKVFGNVFIYALFQNGKPAELFLLRPFYMTVEMGKKGALPSKYIYNTGNHKKEFEVDPKNGRVRDYENNGDILWVKTYNPMKMSAGMPPLSAAAFSVDIHNEGNKWNWSLLKNGAKPSLIATIKGSLDNNSYQRFTENLKTFFQGSDNAGNAFIADGDVDIKEVGITPRDMDYSKSMSEAEKKIAMVLGVPLPLITTDASTFSNMSEAREEFWHDTVIPLTKLMTEEINSFLMPFFLSSRGGIAELDENSPYLCFETDKVPALEKYHERKHNRVRDDLKSGLLTINEAREANDMQPIDGGDVILVPSTLVPLEMLGLADMNLNGEEKALAQSLIKSGATREEVRELINHERKQK